MVVVEMDVAVTVTHALELVMFDVGIIDDEGAEVLFDVGVEAVAFVILNGGGAG